MSRVRAFTELITNFFRKPVTVEESFSFLPENFRWMPQRDAEKCTGCGACLERCSSGATTIRNVEGKKIVSVDSYMCIFCGRCADTCPETALSLTREAMSGSEMKSDGITPYSTDPKYSTHADVNSEDYDRFIGMVSMAHYQGEPKPTTDTELELQKCSCCGEYMPATSKHLQAIRERTLNNLEPETAKVIEEDMKLYLTACVPCRQKHSLEWNTHPRKFI